MKRIEWPNGEQNHGNTWLAVFDQMLADQWSQYTRLHFRFELRKRVFILTGIKINPICPIETFLKSIAATGAFKVIEDS
jgi:hypothetical protein